jgi:aminodeoxychorismate lyase
MNPPFVWINGQLVAEAEATVSVFDRSFLYGDGLFETVRVYAGAPFLWEPHLERLEAGAAHLGIRIPWNRATLATAAAELIRRNGLGESLLRITVSRGIGPRGYSTRGANQPVVVMSTHPAPTVDPENPGAWRLITSSVRLATGDRLANFKTNNKLAQILARSEAEAQGADEALLLNTDGRFAEAASSNLFWLEHEVLCTTPLAEGLLAGVTRAFILDLARRLGWTVAERSCRIWQLQQAAAIFLTACSFEILPASHLDGVPVRQSPRVRELHRAYREAVQASR